MAKTAKDNYFKLANSNFKNNTQTNDKLGDVQLFMAHDIFTLNIFDEAVKKRIISTNQQKISPEKLNKLVILLKYFLRTGISIYHFKNNQFTKKYVYSDNRTINKCLEILKKAGLITYSIQQNKKIPIYQGYNINPTKALEFAISLKSENVFTRGISAIQKEYDNYDDNYYIDEDDPDDSIFMTEWLEKNESLNDIIDRILQEAKEANKTETDYL